MAVAVNGQPATNTVFRLDGVTATNQFFEGIQSYGPSLEAIETVNVVTSSFDADQGMAGGAPSTCRSRRGTNRFSGSAFENVDRRPDARAQLLPAGRPDQGHVERARVRRHAGRPDRPEQAVFFLQRRDDASADAQPATPSGRPSSTVSSRCRRRSCAGGISRASNTVIYDPLTGNAATGFGRMPFAFQNCPGVTTTTDPRLRGVQLHPGEPHQPDRGERCWRS